MTLIAVVCVTICPLCPLFPDNSNENKARIPDAIYQAIKAHGGKENLTRITKIDYKGKGKVTVLGTVFDITIHCRREVKDKSVETFQVCERMNGKVISTLEVRIDGDEVSQNENGERLDLS